MNTYDLQDGDEGTYNTSITTRDCDITPNVTYTYTMTPPWLDILAALLRIADALERLERKHVK